MALSKKAFAKLIVFSGLSLISGCDSGNSSSSNKTGTLSLNVTDGPVDSATKVVVEFTGVSIKPANGEAIEFTFAEPKSIDLLQLQGSASAALLTDQEVASGEYQWIRLHVNAVTDNVLDSYMELDDGTQVELRIPSGSETGLKLVSGFTVAAGGAADFTIDFDLRKSITSPPGQASALLKPALRIVDNLQVGHISGVLASDLINEQCADPSLDDGAIYVFSGADITPMDIQGTATDPLVTALVKQTDDVYAYEIGFLPEGDYTIAYTCDAASDNPEAADTLVFVGTVNVPVLANMESAQDFLTAATAE